jgi:hypothetical protein
MLPTSTYPMWFNVIPPFVPLDLSLYPTYPIGTKGTNSLIFRNYTCYVFRNVYLILEQHVVPPTYIPNSIGNQFHIVVQLVISKDMQHVQYLVTALMPTTIHVTTTLPTYVPRRFDHQPPDEGEPRYSHGGGSPKGNSLKEPPFNPHVGSFGWPTLDLHMFIPPWYQPPVV